MKRILLIASAIYAIVLLSSYTAKEGVMNLADKDKQNSTFFKMSRNSNRLAIFEQLQSLIKVKDSRATTAGIYSNYTDVIMLLGEPNLKLHNSKLVYTLNPTNGCKAIVEYDGSGTVTYLGVKECN